MRLELEDRLRAMYTAVAAATEVDADSVLDGPRLVALTAPPSPTTIRRARIVALVAAAAAVLAGLVLVVSHRHDHQPTASLKDRPYAVPTHVPVGYALVEWELIHVSTMPGFPDGGDHVAHLTYSGPSDHRIEVFSMFDTGATPLDDTATTIGRRQEGGNRFGIRADILSAAELDDMASSMWWVTGAMFTRLTANAGFTPGTYDPWTPPGDDPTVTMRAEASLQHSVQFFASNSGFTFGGASPTTCSPEGTFRSPDDKTVLLRAFSPIDTFRVTLPSGVVRDVPAGIYPGLPNARFATVKIDDARRLALQVECIGGNG